MFLSDHAVAHALTVLMISSDSSATLDFFSGECVSTAAIFPGTDFSAFSVFFSANFCDALPDAGWAEASGVAGAADVAADGAAGAMARVGDGGVGDGVVAAAERTADEAGGAG